MTTEIVEGMHFGHLEVLGRGPSGSSREIYWKCRCFCGEEILVRATHLRSGHTKSCGCRGVPLLVRDKTYNAWSAMRQRCTNPKSPTWSNYGGRGIVVSPLWDDFNRFLQDVGPAPSPSHSLDRIDCNGNYEPGNVKWSTSSDQARNRRSTRVLTSSQGESRSLSAWADLYGIPRNIFLWRIDHGWSLEKATTTPSRPRRRRAESQARAIRRAEAEVASARLALQEAERRLTDLTR